MNRYQFSIINLAFLLIACGGGGENNSAQSSGSTTPSANATPNNSNNNTDDSVGAGDSGNGSNNTTPPSQGNTTPTDNTTSTATDLTNTFLSKRNANCSEYTGAYKATALDHHRGLDFDATLTISSNGTTCTFSTNEIPNHTFNDGDNTFPNNVSTQSGSYAITASPAIAPFITELSLETTNAIFLNGVSMDMLPAGCFGVGNGKVGCGQDMINHPWRSNPIVDNFGTDTHNAHAQPDGTYHYHANPQALFDMNDSSQASPVIGFSADGFPVYGIYFNDNGVIRKALSSYRLKTGVRQAVSGFTTPSGNYDGTYRGDYEFVSGLGDLDECNGMTINGQYGYYITEAYPYVMNCFKGTPNTSFVKRGAALKNRMHGHD
ncbi:YHYH protein [Algicola sagamiensis]|uniref:YHYH protein n=1 Tax=Algicola sagamiensis TaxID=163869 RepID=UPI000363494C|nr:YHYH protein [Algicola sagamiensis]